MVQDIYIYIKEKTHTQTDRDIYNGQFSYSSSSSSALILEAKFILLNMVVTGWASLYFYYEISIVENNGMITKVPIFYCIFFIIYLKKSITSTERDYVIRCCNIYIPFIHAMRI